MSYVIASYAITVATLGVYVFLLLRERKRLADRED